jgi:cation:H+ antiporter
MAGGELLVRGASGLAIKAKVSPLVVGLTVVSLGTSAPELLVSIQAATDGTPDIAMGNVVGSNIANLGLVLAITAIIFPIKIDRLIIRQDWPMMMASSLALFFFALDNKLTFLEGAILFITLIFFTVYLLFRSKWFDTPEPEVEVDDLKHEAKKTLGRLIALVLIGCVGLYFGSEWFVAGAVGIAESFGVSEHIIGVTLVAFGTSVPELAASGIAAYRQQSDISIGNLIGSNIFNILAVLGITSMITPIPITQNLMDFDIFWMLGIALLLFPIMLFGARISRANGLVLLAVYVSFVLLLLTTQQ